MHNIVWDKKGRFRPFNFVDEPKADLAIIIVNRDRPDLTNNLVNQFGKMGNNLLVDTYVIEMGSNKKRLSKYCNFYYQDKDYKGKCYGHNVGLRIACSRKNYSYYLIAMNDLIFASKIDVLETLVGIANRNPKIGILSPTEPESSYIGCRPQSNVNFHLVTTCDYLCLLVRGEAIKRVGFLNPAFKYCWGAIHEYAYKLYRNDWWVAYCDKVTMKHLGGTTYGKLKGIPNRQQYKRMAARFAAKYFINRYGKQWDQEFSKVLPDKIRINAFPIHRKIWESFL